MPTDADARRRAARKASAKGGRNRAETLTPERRREIARKGAQARWANANHPRRTTTDTALATTPRPTPDRADHDPPPKSALPPVVLKPLTPAQAHFCREYVRDCNLARAAKRAGVTAAQASRLLTTATGQAEVVRLATRRRTEEGYAKDTVIARLVDIADADVRDLFTPNGRLKNLDDLDAQISRAVESMDVLESDTGNARLIRVRIASRLKAAELLAKHFGMLDETIKLDVTRSLIPPEQLALLDRDQLDQVRAHVVAIQAILQNASKAIPEDTKQTPALTAPPEN